MRKTLSELEEEIKILNRQINDQLIQIKKLQEDLHEAEERIDELLDMPPIRPWFLDNE